MQDLLQQLGTQAILRVQCQIDTERESLYISVHFSALVFAALFVAVHEVTGCFLFPVFLVCFVTSLVENEGTLCNLLSSLQCLFCCRNFCCSVVTVYTSIFFASCRTTIELCVHWLQKKFSNAVETRGYLGYRFGVMGIYVHGV